MLNTRTKVFAVFIFFSLFASFLLRIASFCFQYHGFQVLLIEFFAFFILFYLFLIDKIQLSKLSIFILIILIYSFFVSYFGYYPPDGLYFLFFLFCLYIFFLSIKNTYKPQHLNIFLNIIFILSFSAAIFTFFEYSLKSASILNITIVPYFLYISSVSNIGGFLYQPNLNALLLNLGLIILIYKILLLKEKKKELFYLFFLYIFIALACAFTSSRAGMLAVAIVFIFLLLSSHFHKLNLTKSQRTKLFLLIFIYFGILFIYQNSPVAKLTQQGLIEDPSVDKRLMIWLSTFLLWLKHPFFGTGLESFKFLNNPYQIEALKILHLPSDLISNFTWSHSEPLQLLEELGIVGAVPIIYISVRYFLKLLRSKHELLDFLFASLILIFFVQGALSWPLRHPVLLFLFFVILAMTDTENKPIFILKKYNKNIFLILFLIIYAVSIFTLFPAIKQDIKYSFNIPKEKIEKIDVSWKLSQNPYLFWLASSKFIYLGTPHYLQLTTGKKYLPKIKEDINNKKMTEKEIKECEILKQRLFIISKKLEKLHKIWLSEHYLGMAYLFNENIKQAKSHAKKGIEMNPNSNALWTLLHFCNIKLGSKKTGKPIIYFLPSKKETESLRKSFQKQMKELQSK